MNATKHRLISVFFCVVILGGMTTLLTLVSTHQQQQQQQQQQQHKRLSSQNDSMIQLMQLVYNQTIKYKYIPKAKDVEKLDYEIRSQSPLILFWGKPWNKNKGFYKEGERIGKCVVTYNRKYIKEAKALVFHFTNMVNSDVPWQHYRASDQIYVFYSDEAPAVIKIVFADLRAFDSFYNFTWTYRSDSDFQYRYGYRGDVIKAVSKGKEAVDQIIAAKTKMAVWVVGKCDHTQGAISRLNYSKELKQAGISISEYGRCFNDSSIPNNSSDILLEVIRKHKFYLAFENALHCKDYITEKFWFNALLADAVPVVWGPTKEDLISVAPLDSYIFAEDFESPQKLAEYLKFLDSNDNEYRKYFRWREDESITDAKMIKMTRNKYPGIAIQERDPNETVCDKLLTFNKSKVIASIQEEFMEANPEECGETPPGAKPISAWFV